MTYKQNLVDRFLFISKALTVGAGFIGALALVGWAYDIRVFQGLIAGLPKINPLTATLLVTVSIAFFFRDSLPVPLTLGLAALVFFGGFLRALDFFGFAVNADAWFMRAVFNEGIDSARMALGTAVSFMCISGAILLRMRSGAYARAAQALAFVALNIGAFSLLGYAYNATFIGASFFFATLAVHAAVAFCFLGLAFLFAYPDEGSTRVFVSEGMGGFIVRRLAPFVCVSVIVGWFGAFAVKLGKLEGGSALAFAVVVSGIMYEIVVWRLGATLEEMDERRREAEKSAEANLRKIRENAASVSEALEAQKTSEGELRTRVEELKQMNNLMVGRELKMAELKEENEKLKEDLRRARERT